MRNGYLNVENRRICSNFRVNSIVTRLLFKANSKPFDFKRITLKVAILKYRLNWTALIL